MGDVQQLQRVVKVEGIEHGLVYGWGIICTEKGEDYYDLNVDREGAYKGQRIPEHISEDEMMSAAVDFAKSHRPGNIMHTGDEVGQYLFIWPQTKSMADAFGETVEKTGLKIGFYPPADVLEQFKNGSLKGFSIEGHSDPRLNELIDA